MRHSRLIVVALQNFAALVMAVVINKKDAVGRHCALPMDAVAAPEVSRRRKPEQRKEQNGLTKPETLCSRFSRSKFRGKTQ
jgi:hypothetical protein